MSGSGTTLVRTIRDPDEVKDLGLHYAQLPTDDTKAKFASEHGVKYSVLSRLEYWYINSFLSLNVTCSDCVQCLIG